MAATRPGNPDRGWNDPPMFMYDAQNKAQESPRRALPTKRVAFPQGAPPQPANAPIAPPAIPPTGEVPIRAPPKLSTSPPDSILFTPPDGTVPSGSPTGPVLMPPVTDTALPPPPSLGPTLPVVVNGPLLFNPNSPQVLGTSSDSAKTAPDKAEEMIKERASHDDKDLCRRSVESLRNTLHAVSDLGVEQRVCDEVGRKLMMLENMWTAGKLSRPVQVYTDVLATALSDRDCDLAHDMHLKLMLDHVSEVRQWMVGVKRLIQEARNLPPNPSKAETVAQETEHSPDVNKKEEKKDNTEVDETKLEELAISDQTEKGTEKTDNEIESFEANSTINDS
ncbi:PREDICTED: steroid receptor RNA activator 1-like [Branchiostoma belcheri]|uniref:Steroid receptor RNA activator 1-like n=1 Tax=Branchiostoma belcheri TaxID=7741 RepID=A0A6P4YI54_BRABE|nr:PREDICTED: steroid receptor RNA activator 1-like [Branchiostoma belcheri]